MEFKQEITEKQIETLIKNFVSINQPYKISDIEEFLQKYYNVTFARKKLYAALNSLVKSEFLIRVKQGMYIKNKDHYDESSFGTDLKKILLHFNEELSDLVSKYNVIEISPQDFELLRQTKLIKDNLEKLL